MFFLKERNFVLIKALWRIGIILYSTMVVVAFVFLSTEFAVSVLIGGGIALLNFWFLERSVYRMFTFRVLKSKTLVMKALFRYYVRFIVTAVVLFLLMRWGMVKPLGLIVGLSVIVLSVFILGSLYARKLYKEAI